MVKDKRPRVLVVDDDQHLLQMMGMMLKRAGYEPFLVSNGMEALQSIREIGPALVVLDIMMPMMKGTEVCRRLREQPETRYLPIIMMSSLDRVDDKLTGFEAGADDYVTKPVNPKELVARINALLMRAHFGRKRLAKVVTVFGAKGGVGTTTVALNLTVALAQREHSVALVELRAGWGALRYLTNLPPDMTLAPLLDDDTEKFKPSHVEELLLSHSSGFKLLLAPQEAPERPLTAHHAELVLDSLTQEREFLIVDLPAHANDEVLQLTLAKSDLVLLVTEPDPFATMCARARLNAMDEWDVLGQTSIVTVARAMSGLSLTRTEVENEMGLTVGRLQHLDYRSKQQLGLVGNAPSVLAMVPPSPESLQAATGAGVPLLLMEPAAPASRALDNLARIVLQQLKAQDPSQPAGL